MRDQVQHVPVPGPEVGEVAVVRSGHCVDVEAFAYGDDRRVGAAEVTVGVAADRLTHAPQVSIDQFDELVGVRVTGAHVLEERGFCRRSQGPTMR